VVRINAEQVKEWSDEEVAHRWMQIFSGPLLMHQYLGNADLTEAELKYVAGLFSTWRNRLCDLSWFMRCLNEPIARMANAEDHCTGRFWEGRFKSQALLDARAVLACMAYVDLNPIRAAMAKTPEQSDYTSIQERILQPENSCLRGFAERDDVGIPFDLKDYLELVDWGGKEIKHNKRGYIPSHTPPILARLKMNVAPVELPRQGRSTSVWRSGAGDDAPGFCQIGWAKFYQRPITWQTTFSGKDVIITVQEKV